MRVKNKTLVHWCGGNVASADLNPRVDSTLTRSDGRVRVSQDDCSLKERMFVIVRMRGWYLIGQVTGSAMTVW